MKKLLIDLDEVICISEFLPELNKFNHSSFKLEDFENYYIDDCLGSKEKIEEFNKSLANKNLYNKPYIIEGSIESIEKLSKHYEIFILSSCINPFIVDKSSRIFSDKYNFIRKHLPFINPNNIIFTGSKNIFKADVQIDDYIKNLKSDIPTKLLFTAYHNKKLNNELHEFNIKRVNNWKEVLDILLTEKFINN